MCLIAIFIAVTPSDDSNLIASITEKHRRQTHFYAVRNPQYMHQTCRAESKIDYTINPELETAATGSYDSDARSNFGGIFQSRQN